MRHSTRLRLGLIASILLGCTEQESPLARLEQEDPIVASELTFSSLKVSSTTNGDRVLITDTSEEVTPIQATPSELVTITGHIASSDWKMRKVINSWKYDDGLPHSFTQSGPIPKAFCELWAYVQGNDVYQNRGIVHQTLLEARPHPDHPDELEFRVRFRAPKRKGKYVLEIRAIDRTIQPGVTGIDQTNPDGFVIRRHEFLVE